MSGPLLVPMRVDALCVADEDKDAHLFGRRTIQFDGLPSQILKGGTGIRAANLSDNYRGKPFETDTSHLLHRRGIHLHWALPDALTRACVTERGINFPVVPNRWLVVRIMPGGQAKSWVVESDYLCLEKKEGEDPVTVPTPDAKDGPYRYIGRVVPLELWREGYEEKYARFRSREVFAPLTAVGHGQAHFAAYYPDCNSVFGFHDHFSDFDPAYQHDMKPSEQGFLRSQCSRLSYCVIGWYSDLRNDPLRITGQSLDDLKWKLSADGAPDRSLLHGMVLGIDWDPLKKGGYPTRKFGRPSVAVGNTAAEALSALLASKAKTSDSRLTEKLLNALQLGLARDLNRPQAVAALDAALHREGFGAEYGGTVWSLAQDEAAAQSKIWEESAAPAATDPVHRIARSFGERLDGLNRRQLECDALERRLASIRWQMFSDWYKHLTVLYARPDPRSRSGMQVFLRERLKGNQNAIAFALRTALQQVSGLVRELKERKAELESEAEKLAESIESEIAAINSERVKRRQAPLPVLRLKPIAAPNFLKPNEPVVLLEGEVVQPSPRHGHDGDGREDGFLQVRAAAQLGTVASRVPLGFPDAELAAPVNALVAEALGFAEDPSGSKPGGAPPSPLAITRWTGMPWNPLLLQWSVAYFPVQTIRSGQPDLPESSVLPESTAYYDPRFLQENGFAFDPDRIDLRHSGKASPGFQAYQGACILSSRAVHTLKHFAEQFLGQLEEKDRLNILDRLEHRPVLSQALGGFNAALIQRNLQTQFEVLDPLIRRVPAGAPAPDYLDQSLQAFVGEENTAAPLPYGNYSPIRAGYLQLERLRIVDSFGQLADVNDFSELVRSQALASESEPARIYLAPRIAQPSRLLFRWISSGDDNLETNDHPMTSPVCGWVMTNHLDRSVMVFDASGHALGALNQPKSDAAPRWREAPGHEPGPIDAHLAAFIAGFEKGGTGFLSEFIETVDRAKATIDVPDFRPGQSIAFLIGRPLALVRASLRLELEGNPAYDQSWGAFGAAETRGFDRVGFPVVLGDLENLRDGLVGFFRDDEPVFYSGAVRGAASGPVRLQSSRPLELSPNGGDLLRLTLLIEPHARVHASMGILPAKAIDLPPQHFTPALEAMEVTFQTAPILRRRGARPALPIPNESGLIWTWHEGPDAWDVTQARTDAMLEDGPLELSDGFLKLKIPART